MATPASTSTKKLVLAPLLLVLLAIAGAVTAAQQGRPAATPLSTAQPPASAPPSSPTKPAAPAAKPSPKPTAAPTEIILGFWNIEWFGKPEDRSGVAQGIAQKPAEIADAIVQSRCDVVGLAEIVTRVVGRPIRSRDIESVIDEIAKKTGDRWDYVLNPGRADGDQLTGAMWNTARITALSADAKPWTQGKDEAWPIPTRRARSAQGSSLWNRPPTAIKFVAAKDKTDFVLIVVHMKADYNGDFAAHRKEEAQALVDALPQVKQKFKDSDIVIIGDTNMIADVEPATNVLTDAGFTDLNPGKIRTNWRSGSMDRAFIYRSRPATAKSALDSASDAFKKSAKIDDREFKRRLSDHFLIVTRIGVVADDD